MTLDVIIALSLSAVLIIAFIIIFMLLLRGFNPKEFLRFLKHKLKEDVDEVIIKKPLSRERQRELLMKYCRDISVTPVNDVERKLNIMCIQILEDNPEICTMEELMTELDKMDKNLLINTLKGDSK